VDDPTAAPAPAPAPVEDANGMGPAETRLWRAAIDGEVGQPEDLEADFKDSRHWVRADFVRFLATEKDKAHTLHERGVRLRRLRVIGTLDLSGCEVRRPLRFEDCLLDEVRVTGARLATLSFDASSVGSITGDRVAATAVFLRRTTVRQGARFLGAQIAGDLDCDGATLDAEQPIATGPQPAVAGLDVALGLDGASIGGAFFLRGTTLVGQLSASSITVGKVFDARGAKVRTGQLQLHSAIIGGDADFGGAVIVDLPGAAPSPHRLAVNLTQARVGGTLRLGDRFAADRGVQLNDLRVGGNLTLRGGRFIGKSEFAIVAQRMLVEGSFDLDSTTCFGLADLEAANAGRPTSTSRLAPRRKRGESAPVRAPGCALDLTAASVGSLSDQWADWPRGNRVLGFRYKAIVGATSTRAAWWESWLALQVDEDKRRLADDQPRAGMSSFKNQPWDQAILALRDVGCERDAEDLAIAKERAAHAHDTTPWHPLHVLWGWCAGYGYRPLRLLWALAVVYPLSAWIYAEAAEHGAMAPTREDLLARDEYQRCHPEHGGNWTHCALAPAYPDFNARAYALQMLLPAIELRQAKEWAPVPWVRPVVPIAPPRAASGAASVAVAVAVARAGEAEAEPRVSGWGWTALACSRVEAASGLAAPVLVALALTGLIRRKQKD